MTFTEHVLRTINPELNNEERILNSIMGISGEAGEMADCFKKHFFQDHSLDRNQIVNESGDLLYYLHLLWNSYNITMEEVFAYNVDKLNKRFPAGFSKEASINRKV